MRCSRCGAENRETARFCDSCGGPFRQGATSDPKLASTPTYGERRRLTVLFCELAGSTEIAARLDPEEWREIVADYHRTAAEAIDRFGGYVAQYLSDGIMAYFGWPEAHDNDAERAALAGLAIIDAVPKLNENSQRPKLSARAGIDSGAVVVGASTGKSADVFGETPNIAARVQAAAVPGDVLVTANIHRLLQGLFEVEDRGTQTLKGIEEPVHVFRVVQPSRVRSRLEAIAAVRGLTPFIGRTDELHLLMGVWERVLEGEGQVVMIRGEAGIGKSRLLHQFQQQIAGRPYNWVEVAAAPFFQNTPFYAVAEMLRQLQAHYPDLGRAATPAQQSRISTRLTRSNGHSREDLPSRQESPEVDLFSELAATLSPTRPGKDLPSTPLSGRQRVRLLTALVQWVLDAAHLVPLVIAIEDLHWADPSTLELIQLLIVQGAKAPLLLLHTARPEFRVSWRAAEHVVQVALDPLNANSTRTIVERVAGEEILPEETIASVIKRTGGVPLFIEELTRAVLESGNVKRVLDPIPTTLHDSLMARLDRLGAARETLQLGAVLGTEFTYDLLLAVNPLSENDLQRHLLSLTEAELLCGRGEPPDASYQFKHALIRDAAYERLLKSRRRELHTRIAQTMEERFPERTISHPEILAYHCTEAGLIAQAIDNWQNAGRAAIARSANAEAIAHLRTALGLLPKLPESQDRDRRELSLLDDYGVALITLKGWYAPEVGDGYRRAWELCKKLGETHQLMSLLFGLSAFHLCRAELRVCQDYAHEMSLLPSAAPHEKMVLVGWSFGSAKFFLGEFAEAHENVVQAVRHYDKTSHRGVAFLVGHDLCVNSLMYDAMALLILGYPDQGEYRFQEALALARELGYPFTLTQCLGMSAMYACIRRDFNRLPAIVRETRALAHEHGFTFWEEGISAYELIGLAAQGQREELKIAMQQAKKFSQVEYECAGTWARANMAEGFAGIGRVNVAFSLLAEAFEMMNRNGERYAEAEIARIRGVLALKQVEGRECSAIELRAAEAEAERAFRDAQEIANRQGAKLYELRAANDLGRLMIRIGRRDEALPTLRAIYASFNEGFDAPDLRAAHALLKTLGSERP